MVEEELNLKDIYLKLNRVVPMSYIDKELDRQILNTKELSLLERIGQNFQKDIWKIRLDYVKDSIQYYLKK
jgi:hypothetical protein